MSVSGGIVDPPPGTANSRSDGKKRSNFDIYQVLNTHTTSKARKEDPLKILDPSCKKLVTVESQRIMSVLDDTINRLKLVTVIPDVTTRIEEFEGVVGGDICTMLREHYNLEKDFSEVVMKQEEDEPTPSVTKVDASDSILSSATGESLEVIRSNLSHQLRHSTRCLLRLLAHDPSSVEAVLSGSEERSPSAVSLLGTAQNLRAIIMEKLLTTREEEVERARYIDQVTQREAKASLEVKRLEGLLHEASQAREAELNKRNILIKRLKSDLARLQKMSSEANMRLKGDSIKQEIADQKSSDQRCQRLQQSIQQLKQQLAQSVADHRASEGVLRSKKLKTESSLETWIQKYDSDMMDRHEEFEQIDMVYKQEKRQLEELDDKFKTLSEEYDFIMEERRLEAERKAEEERRQRLLTKAAVIIQAHWRSYFTRKKLKSKKKGKKGKKKGKRK